MPALKSTTTDFSLWRCGPLRYVGKMDGSAQSMLVRDLSDRLWVLKPKTDLQGPNALANEFLGAELCKALKLPIPEYRIVEVDSNFSDDQRVCVNTASGRAPIPHKLHFASRYMPDDSGQDYAEHIPSIFTPFLRNQSECLGMFVFDVWAMHADRRQALFRVQKRGIFPTFVDNSHLFGGAYGKQTKPLIDGGLVQRCAFDLYKKGQMNEFWFQRMESTIPSALQAAARRTPLEWYSGQISALVDLLLNRLRSLRPLVELAFATLDHRVKTISELHLVRARATWRDDSKWLITNDRQFVDPSGVYKAPLNHSVPHRRAE